LKSVVALNAMYATIMKGAGSKMLNSYSFDKIMELFQEIGVKVTFLGKAKSTPRNRIYNVERLSEEDCNKIHFYFPGICCCEEKDYTEIYISRKSRAEIQEEYVWGLRHGFIDRVEFNKAKT